MAIDQVEHGNEAQQTELLADMPLQPRDASEPVPLMPAQLKSLKKKGKQHLSRRTCLRALRIRGPFDIELLRKSLEVMVQRHEALRTRIVIDQDTPFQFIDAACAYELNVVRISSLSVDDAEREAARLAQELVDAEIDLSVGPLFEARLLQLSSIDHILVVVLDHIVSDAVSADIFDKELWILYGQATQGLPFSLPQLPVQFGDHAVWQQRMYGAWLREHEAYWRERLTGAPHVIVPQDGDLIEADQPTTELRTFSLSENLSGQLRELALRENARLPFVVCVVYAVLMSRWCNQQDLTIGFVSHGRSRRTELRNMIGLLGSTLYLRIKLSGDLTFLDILKLVSVELLGAREHHDYGQLFYVFPDLKTDLVFNWVSHDWMQRSVDKLQGLNNQLRIEQFPIKNIVPPKILVFFSDSAAGIAIRVYYRSDLFTSNTIEWFAHNFRLIAEAFTKNPLACLTSVSTKEKDGSGPIPA